MRLRPLSILSVAVLLAGCANDEPASPDADAAMPSATGSMTSVAPEAKPWTAEAVPVSFSGNLGTSLHGCVFPANLCNTIDATTGASDFGVERPGANFTGLDLTVTWTAQTPATATLTLGFMVMATCDGCNSTSYEEVTGTSPLHATVAGASVPLSEDAAVHVYLYNPQGLVYNPAAPAYAFASVDQAFLVEGTVSLLVPPNSAS